MPLKVLMVTNMYPSEERPGWGAFIKSQIDSISRRDVDVDVMVIEGYRGATYYAKAIWELRKRCRRNRYDLIHAHYGLSGVVARTQFRFPILVSFCGDDLYGTPNRFGIPTVLSRLFMMLHRGLVYVVDGVIVKSEAMRKLVPGQRASVIANGVQLDVFRPLDQGECRRALGLQEDIIYLFFPYSPRTLRKNYVLVSEAVKMLNEEGGRRFEILTVENALPEQMPLYFNASDLLILVSMWEGSPNAVKEAMACNTRIVATDVGDVKEIIGNTAGCEICTPTVTAVVDSVRRVLTAPLKTNGRAAMTHLAIETVAAQVIREYQSLLQHRQRTEKMATPSTHCL
jgi:glycosyltransferase involved in cell wall biosynthesis